MDLEKDREIKPEEDQVLPELLELLEIFRDLPEARKKNLKTRLRAGFSKKYESFFQLQF